MSSIKINHKILSIPPYISTAWKNIVSLKTEQNGNTLSLHIFLQDGSSVVIPGISCSLVDTIFASHARHVEEELSSTTLPLTPPPFLLNADKNTSSFLLDIPIPLGGFKALTSVLQHDPEKENDPEFPQDMTDKITEITKTMGVQDPQFLPKSEPGCGCPHCQIAKAMHAAFEPRTPIEFTEEEEVQDAELSFKSWIVLPPKENIYKVIHPDNAHEEYNVYLGSPISCTCGSNGCEHILAVLKT